MKRPLASGSTTPNDNQVIWRVQRTEERTDGRSDGRRTSERAEAFVDARPFAGFRAPLWLSRTEGRRRFECSWPFSSFFHSFQLCSSQSFSNKSQILFCDSFRGLYRFAGRKAKGRKSPDRGTKSSSHSWMTAYSYGRNNGCGREHIRPGPLCGVLVWLLLERENTRRKEREAEKGGWFLWRSGLRSGKI